MCQNSSEQIFLLDLPLDVQNVVGTTLLDLLPIVKYHLLAFIFLFACHFTFIDLLDKLVLLFEGILFHLVDQD